MAHDGVTLGYPTPTSFRRLTGCQQDPRDRGVTNHICSAWLGTTGTCLGFDICIYMRTWCLDFDICGAFELFHWPLMHRLVRDHRYAPIVLFGRVFMHVRY